MKKLAAFFLMAAAMGSAQAGPSGYHLARTVPLDGDSFWDLMAFDPMHRHLFITHGTHVVVVDADKYTVAGDIPNIPQVHGVAIAVDLGKGFVTAGGTNSLIAFDLASLKKSGAIAVGAKPDAILYEPSTHRVFAFNAGSNNATAVDGASGKVAGTIALGGQPEMAATDEHGTVFLNLEDKSELLRINAKTLIVETRWPLAPCEEPSSIAMDVAHARLFVGCHNKIMAVVDAVTGKMIATPAIGLGVDSNRFDPGTQFAFSSNGEGTLTVVHEDDPQKFSEVESVSTQNGARTMELDPKTHSVFLVTADTVPVSPTPGEPRPRPKIVPNTFRLLVFAR